MYRDLRTELPASGLVHLDLSDGTPDSDALLERIVSLAYRKARTDEAVKAVHIITAPICSNGGEVREDELAVPTWATHGDAAATRLLQVCVRHCAAASQLQGSFLGAIFVKTGAG